MPTVSNTDIVCFIQVNYDATNKSATKNLKSKIYLVY